MREGGVRLTLRAKLRRPHKLTGGHSGGVAEPTLTDSGNEALSFNRKALGRLGPTTYPQPCAQHRGYAHFLSVWPGVFLTIYCPDG